MIENIILYTALSIYLWNTLFAISLIYIYLNYRNEFIGNWKSVKDFHGALVIGFPSIIFLGKYIEELEVLYYIVQGTIFLVFLWASIHELKVLQKRMRIATGIVFLFLSIMINFILSLYFDKIIEASFIYFIVYVIAFVVMLVI